MYPKSPWSNTATFRKWFSDLFLSFLRQTTLQNIDEVMDSYGAHGTDRQDLREQVDVYSLLLNFKSIHQPMDHGTIASFKNTFQKIC